MTNQNEFWGAEHKTIKQVIQELQTFEDQHLIVMVSNDGGDTLKPIKLLGKEFIDDKPYCTLFIEK